MENKKDIDGEFSGKLKDSDEIISDTRKDSYGDLGQSSSTPEKIISVDGNNEEVNKTSQLIPSCMEQSLLGQHQTSLESLNNVKEACIRYWEKDLGVLYSLVKSKHLNSNILNYEGFSILTLAASCGNKELVKALLEGGASINYEGTLNDVAPLMVASIFRHSHIVKILLQSGADVYRTTFDKNSALHFACRHGHEEIILDIFRAGALPYLVNTTGKFPIMEAYGTPNFSQIYEIFYPNQLTLGNNNINCIEEENSTLLEKANIAIDLFADIIESILSKTMTNEKFHSKFTLSCLIGESKLINTMIDYALDNDISIQCLAHNVTAAVYGGNIDAIKTLADRGFSVDIRSTDGVTPLMEACNLNRIDVVNELISNGADVNLRTFSSNETALSIAAKNGYFNLIRILLLAQADPNCGFQPLISACYSCSCETAKIFIDGGSDVNLYSDIYGSTPLTAACEGGSLPIVEHLINNGADINLIDHAGNTPLMCACCFGHFDIVKFLISVGADINKIDERNLNNALSVACSTGQYSIASLLAESGAEILHEFKSGKTIFMDACKSGDVSMAKCVLGMVRKELAKNDLQSKYTTQVQPSAQSKVNIKNQAKIPNQSDPPNLNNVPNKILLTTSMKKIGSKKISEAEQDIIRLFGYLKETKLTDTRFDKFKSSLCNQDFFNSSPLSKKEKMYINRCTKARKETALSIACGIGSITLVKLLNSYQASINGKHQRGYTPLMIAVINGHIKVCEQLLNNEADINAKEEEFQNTPLHFAVLSKNDSMVEFLLQKGADVSNINMYKQNPLIIAVLYEMIISVKHLLKAGSDPNGKSSFTSVLELACVKNCKDIALELISAGSDVGSLEKGDSVLYASCYNNSIDVFKALVDSLGIENELKKFPSLLANAATGNAVNVGEYLIKCGVNIDAMVNTTDVKSTALMIAASFGCTEFVLLLLKYNAKIDIFDIYGETALWMASSYGHVNIIQILISAGATVDHHNHKKISCLEVAYRNGFKDAVICLLKIARFLPNVEDFKKYNKSISSREMEFRIKVRECATKIMEVRNIQEQEDKKTRQALSLLVQEEVKNAPTKKANKKKKRKSKNNEPDKPISVPPPTPPPISLPQQHIQKPKLKPPKVEAPKIEEPKIELSKTTSYKTPVSKIESPKNSTSKNIPKIEPPSVKAAKITQSKIESPKIVSSKITQHKVELPKAKQQKSMTKTIPSKYSEVKEEENHTNLVETPRKSHYGSTDDTFKIVKAYISCGLVSRFIGKNGSFVNAIRQYTNTSIDVDTCAKTQNNEYKVNISGAFKDILIVLSVITAVHQDPDRMNANIIDDIEDIKISYEPTKYTIQTPSRDKPSFQQRNNRPTPGIVSVTDIPPIESQPIIVQPQRVVKYEEPLIKLTPKKKILIPSSVGSSTVIWSPEVESFGKATSTQNHNNVNYASDRLQTKPVNLCPGSGRPINKSKSSIEPPYECPIWNIIHNPKNDVGITFDKELWMKTSVSVEPYPKSIYDLLKSFNNMSFVNNENGQKVTENDPISLQPPSGVPNFWFDTSTTFNSRK